MSHQLSRRDYGYKPHPKNISKKAKVMMRAVEREKLEAEAHSQDYVGQIINKVFGKALTPDHGFNSERSQRTESGGRP